jgi:hypothetical protein
VPTGNIVVGGLFVIDALNADPLQTVTFLLAIVGVGFTFTVSVKGLPVHDPAAPDFGVMV